MVRAEERGKVNKESRGTRFLLIQEGLQLISPASPGHEPFTKSTEVDWRRINLRTFVACLTVSAAERASSAASGSQRPAALLKILWIRAAFCSGPKQVTKCSVWKAIQPSSGAAHRPSSRNLSGAQTERPSNHIIKHPFQESKSRALKFF